MDLIKELELRVIQLEKDHTHNKDLIDLILDIVKELKAWRNQFKSKNGHGFVPKIIDGVTEKFEQMFHSYQSQVDLSFTNHKEAVNTIVTSIPCSKMLGEGCTYRLISKDDPIPPGFKEVKEIKI